MKPATHEAVKAIAAKQGINPSCWVVGLVTRELQKASIL